MTEIHEERNRRPDYRFGQDLSIRQLDELSQQRGGDGAENAEQGTDSAGGLPHSQCVVTGDLLLDVGRIRYPPRKEGERLFLGFRRIGSARTGHLLFGIGEDVRDCLTTLQSIRGQREADDAEEDRHGSVAALQGAIGEENPED